MPTLRGRFNRSAAKIRASGNDSPVHSLDRPALSLRQIPTSAHKVTGIAGRIAFKIILMFRLRFPEVAGGGNFRDYLVRFARPNIQIYDARVVDLYQWVCARYPVGVEGAER